MTQRWRERLTGAALATAVLLLTAQNWTTGRISWTYSGLDEAGNPEAPATAEYRIVLEGNTVDDAIATYNIDLATPGVPVEGGEYRADEVDVSTIPPGNYTASVRLFDDANNGSPWTASSLQMLPPKSVTLPQVVPISGSNGEVAISGTLTLTEVTP